MVVSKIGNCFDFAVNKISKRISTPLNRELNTYVNDRIVYNATLIDDTYSVSRKAKMLQKVSKKAKQDWHSMNKFKSYAIKNSEKIAKVSLAVIAGGCLVTGIKLISDSMFSETKK